MLLHVIETAMPVQFTLDLGRRGSALQDVDDSVILLSHDDVCYYRTAQHAFVGWLPARSGVEGSPVKHDRRLFIPGQSLDYASGKVCAVRIGII
jgi:hypothetical protein